jgi:dihydrofolate reductase
VDETFSTIMDKELSVPFDMPLGKTTYDIFARYWPKHPGSIGTPFDKATKYVVSDKPVDLTWKESVLMDGDVVTKIKTFKEEDGPMVQVHGSYMLLRTLLQNDLIDELRLRIFPITLGTGKRLFAEGTIPGPARLRRVCLIEGREPAVSRYFRAPFSRGKLKKIIIATSTATFM